MPKLSLSQLLLYQKGVVEKPEGSISNCAEFRGIRGQRKGEMCQEKNGLGRPIKEVAYTIPAPREPVRITNYFQDTKPRMVFTLGNPACHIYWEHTSKNELSLNTLKAKLGDTLPLKCTATVNRLFVPEDMFSLSVYCPCLTAQDASETSDQLVAALNQALRKSRKQRKA